jgi:anaphase-promoting complex subunit 7
LNLSESTEILTMNSIHRLIQLFEEELYSSAYTMAHFIISNPQSGNFHLKQEEIFTAIVIAGCSLWEMKSYSEAQKQFETATICRRQIKDQKITSNVLEIVEKFSEVELKFRAAKCMVENQQFKEAAGILQFIPLKQRSAKINMLLAKIQQGESATDKHLITNYKEVLRKCPLAFDAIDGLISLGVKGTEVNSLIIGE